MKWTVIKKLWFFLKRLFSPESEESKSIARLSAEQQRKRIMAAERTGMRFSKLMSSIFDHMETCETGYVEALPIRAQRDWWSQREKELKEFKHAFDVDKNYFSHCKDKALLDYLDLVVDDLIVFFEYPEEQWADDAPKIFIDKKAVLKEKQRHIVSCIQKIIHFYESAD